MVFGAYEKYVFGPRREAIKRAKEAKERAKEVSAAWKAWNERRLQAEARGEPFNEPVPGDEEVEGHMEGTGEHKMPEDQHSIRHRRSGVITTVRQSLFCDPCPSRLSRSPTGTRLATSGLTRTGMLAGRIRGLTWIGRPVQAAPTWKGTPGPMASMAIHSVKLRRRKRSPCCAIFCWKRRGKRTQGGSIPKSASGQRERFWGSFWTGFRTRRTAEVVQAYYGLADARSEIDKFRLWA